MYCTSKDHMKLFLENVGGIERYNKINTGKYFFFFLGGGGMSKFTPVYLYMYMYM